MLPILLTSVISIVSVPIYFRVLGTEMYAMWFYVGTLTGAFGFMDLGIGVAVGRYMGVAMGAGDEQAVREYWSTGHVIALPFLIFFALIFVILGTIWGPHWFKVPAEKATILRWAMLFGGISLFLNYYGQMWNILAQAKLDFKFLSILRSIISVASTGGALAVALFIPNVAFIVAFTTLLAAIQFFLLVHRGNHTYQLPVLFSQYRKSRFLEMLPYTLKTFGQLIAGSVLGSLDRLFLGRFAPAIDFAAFNVSMNIGSRITGLSVAIMGPVFNNTNRGIGGDTMRSPARVYQESFNFMFPWYSLMILGVFLWSGPVTELWLGSKYGDAVGQAFPWIVSALCLVALGNISSAQLGSLNRVGTSLLFQIAISIVSLIGVVAGWHVAGLYGAAVGFFITRLLCIGQDFFTRNLLNLDVASYAECFAPILRQATVQIPLWAIAINIFNMPLSLSLCAVLSALVSVIIEFRYAFHTSHIEVDPASKPFA